MVVREYGEWIVVGLCILMVVVCDFEVVFEEVFWFLWFGVFVFFVFVLIVIVDFFVWIDFGIVRVVFCVLLWYWCGVLNLVFILGCIGVGVMLIGYYKVDLDCDFFWEFDWCGFWSFERLLLGGVNFFSKLMWVNEECNLVDIVLLWDCNEGYEGCFN